MSVKGFKLRNGTEEQYDYGYLDNIDVQTSHIHNGAVTKAKIAENSISTSRLEDASVTTDKIASGAVTKAKIAENSISASRLEDASVVTNKIASGAVTKVKIAENSIDTSRLEDASVTIDKIANRAVGVNKLSDEVSEILANKANIDGSYSGMTVGLAEQLQSIIFALLAVLWISGIKSTLMLLLAERLYGISW